MCLKKKKHKHVCRSNTVDWRKARLGGADVDGDRRRQCRLAPPTSQSAAGGRCSPEPRQVLVEDVTTAAAGRCAHEQKLQQNWRQDSAFWWRFQWTRQGKHESTVSHSLNLYTVLARLASSVRVSQSTCATRQTKPRIRKRRLVCFGGVGE